jgi:cysteinyl-tRNA synthetase
MKSSARGEVAPKDDPMDFVLWKPSKPGEPAWPSPAGIKTLGRPGWHIECSAMSWKYLGEQFDIHGGGVDLLFPHHENERAQSGRAFGKHHRHEMARYWVHNGFLQVEGEKMSKSLGNFITIRELLDKLPGDVVRLQMLMTHYRQPLDWTETSTQLARRELEDWAHLLHRYYSWRNNRIPHAVIAELGDDLNTPNAIAVVREQYTAARKGGTEELLQFAASCKFLGFRNLGEPGLFDVGVSALNVPNQNISKYSETVTKIRAAYANNAPTAVKSDLLSILKQDGLDVRIEKGHSILLVQGDREELEDKVEKMIASRTAARARKEWPEADRIRSELLAMGVELEDHKDGTTTWKVKQ